MADKALTIKVCSPLNLRGGLTGKCHAICHYSYNLPFYNIEKEDTIYLEIDKAIEEAQRIDKELHTKEQIILRELINYECFYICDFTDVVEPLQDYGYTLQDIQTIFYIIPTKIFRMKTIHRRIANGLAKSEGGLLIALNAYGALLKQNESTAHSAEEREELVAMLKRVRELIVKYRYPGSVFNIYKKQPDEK